MMSSRREVIKTLFLGAAFSNFIGQGWTRPLLLHLQAAPDHQQGFLKVSLADFPDLAKPRGSVRISTSKLDSQTHKQVGLFPPVIINRGDNGEFYVLSAACTHEDCIVPRVDKASNLMTCPCHGSKYQSDGTVVMGPAQQSLRAFEFELQNGVMTITLPEVFFEITVEKAAAGARLQIMFIGFVGITYELYFRDTIGSVPQQISFATSNTGPVNQTEIAGTDDYLPLFVERPGRFGFFEVVMKTQVV